MKTQSMYVYLFLTISLILAGCGGKTITKKQFIIEPAQKTTVKAMPSSPASLEVRGFAIDSQFSGKQIVYRKSQFRYVPDYYNEFFTPPSTMLTQASRNFLADSGLFARVLEPGSGMISDFTLDASIIELYADIRAKTAPKAILKIRIFLNKKDKGAESLVLTKTYDISEPMKNTQAESFIEAISRCTTIFLQQMQQDIQKQII